MSLRQPIAIDMSLLFTGMDIWYGAEYRFKRYETKLHRPIIAASTIYG